MADGLLAGAVSPGGAVDGTVALASSLAVQTGGPGGVGLAIGGDRRHLGPMGRSRGGCGGGLETGGWRHGCSGR